MEGEATPRNKWDSPLLLLMILLPTTAYPLKAEGWGGATTELLLSVVAAALATADPAPLVAPLATPLVTMLGVPVAAPVVAPDITPVLGLLPMFSLPLSPPPPQPATKAPTRDNRTKTAVRARLWLVGV